MKILNIEQVCKAHVFDVAKVLIELPDGRQRYYDLVQHCPAVVIVPLTEDGKILFVRQYRLGAEKELLELPAGLINNGEDPDPAAERELREETGYEGCFKDLVIVQSDFTKLVDLFVVDVARMFPVYPFSMSKTVSQGYLHTLQPPRLYPQQKQHSPASYERRTACRYNRHVQRHRGIRLSQETRIHL